MRVSERTIYANTEARIESAKDNNVQALNFLSTEKRIIALHDDPTGAARVVRHRDRIQEIESFKSNVEFSKGFLTVTESAVTNIQERLGRARDLSIAMANDTYAIDSRKATAKEIDEIINEVIQIANSRYNSKYVFSGFRTDAPAMDRDGVYMGDDGNIFLQVDRGRFKNINIPGRHFFETTEDERRSGHYNMLDSLNILREGLEADDKAVIYRAVDELSFHLDKASSFLASIGALFNSVSELGKYLDLSSELERTAMSELEDVDIFKATSDFKRTEGTLQSTLLAANKLLQPSLLNFIQ